LLPAEISAINDLCDTFVGVVNATDQRRASMQSMVAWRDEILFGEPEGGPAPEPPAFPAVTFPAATLGTVPQFFSVRDRIVSAKGYTLAIGEDLGIVGPEMSQLNPDNVAPSLKPTTSAGYWVNLSGSMQGMDAMRVEYAPKGGNFTTVAFLTNTPGGFQITPANPNQPEMGHIRAVFIKKNAEFGNYSADYPVTVS